jgi:hypothetical protein
MWKGNVVAAIGAEAACVAPRLKGAVREQESERELRFEDSQSQFSLPSALRLSSGESGERLLDALSMSTPSLMQEVNSS